jgi:hypothetical protein
MAKKVTVSLEVSYVLKGEILKEYEEWLDDHRDSVRMRKWFAIDRAVGVEQWRDLAIDKRMKLVTKEETVA